MNKERLIEAVKNIPIVAERDKWAITLDRDEGALFYAPKVIPSDSALHQVTDEYALYIDKNSHPTGVVVEYFRGNFLKHHKTFEDIVSVFDKQEKVLTIPADKHNADKNVEIFKALLETTLIKEADANFVPA